MEISKTDIAEAVMKLRQAGKKLPQADRIKAAANKVEEEQKVLAETINIISKIFVGRQISKCTWDDVVERAMLRYDMNSTIITPSLLQICFDEITKENQINSSFKAEANNKPLDDEERYSSLSAIKWTSLTMGERKKLYRRGVDAITKYVRNNEAVIHDAVKRLGISEAEARKYLLILKCWDNDIQYAKDNKTEAKTYIAFNNEGCMRLMYQ